MRCVKTRKKNSIPSRSVPTGCLFSPLSSWNPLEHVHTHTRTHVHCISASSLSTTPPPPTPSHVSLRGCQEKWLPFKRPTQRSEITRLSARSAVRAHNKNSDTRPMVSASASPMRFYFLLLFVGFCAYRQNAQAANTCLL